MSNVWLVFWSSKDPERKSSIEMENKGEAKRRYFVSEIETTKRAVKDLQENLVNSRKGRKILNF